MSKTIVIIGVTGIQGSSVADTFLRNPDWRVSGVTRDPSSAASQSLAAKGVKLFKGDVDDVSTLLPAFKGANVIFSNTDYFGHISAALSSPSILKGGQTANEYAFAREVEQGLNIAEAASSPAVLQTLDRFILSSLSHATKWSAGKYTNVYHNDAKAAIIQGISTRFPQLASKMSTLQLGHYVRMWQVSPLFTPQKQDDGSFVIRRSFSPGYKMPFVVAHKDTGEFVRALVEAPPGTNLLGVSEHMTWVEWTKLWGETLGVTATFERVGEEEYFQGVPEPLSRELAETFRYVEEFGYTGGDPEVVTVDQLGIKITLTSMREYIKSEDWSSVL
ncbi:hypothetical protein H2200_003078 [Cladophialophora chaetospira]|uniref:NmrA-like domain-containing protein n=1 Tax=Cladophialophora chaetospira TaxID=386627 RepID=A0AA38XGT8_9EURO|nr:hypothetical protein H2200_003078 [Cladophialophora chaetospira]